jgi:hypothetical protein
LPISQLRPIRRRINININNEAERNIEKIDAPIIGLFVTITDIVTLANIHYHKLQELIVHYGNELVLDEVMKDLFGPEGLLCVSIGSWVGTVLLYLLPIESEMRLRIMRQAAWSCGFAQHGGRDQSCDRGQNQYDSIPRVMFQPGGV